MKLISFSLNSGIDDRLIKKVGNGDQKSFDILYHKTKKIVFGIALSITKSPSDADDIVQEVYIKIIENAKTYHSEGKPLAWIYRISKNQAISFIRKTKKVDNVETIENDIRFSAINEFDNLILKSALEILNDEDLEIVMMYTSGLKHKEIAELTNLNLSTVLSKYNRALIKMRKFLEKK